MNPCDSNSALWKTVVITGAAGFLGSACSEEAERRGWKVVRCGRGAKGPGWCHYDCNDDASASRLPLDCHAVIHCAAIAHRFPPNEPSEAEFLNVNGHAAATLARLARDRARRFVLVSSIAATDEGSAGSRSIHPAGLPRSAYGRSKLLAERLVSEALNGSSTSLVVVRFPAIHGPGAPGAIGQLASWIESGRPLPSFSDDVRRSLIGIDNATDALLTACRHPGLAGATVTPTDGDAPSVLSLARTIGKIVGRDVRTVPIPRSLICTGTMIARRLGLDARLITAAERMLESAVTSDRTMQEIAGWKPPITLEIGLSRALGSS